MKAIEVYKPDSWKSYTIGDPLAPSKSPWRLDDEQVVYPFYEKAVKAGINTLCIHKGLLPPDYEKSFAGVWEYATAWDIGKAAKDWPQMNFVIYHSGAQDAIPLPPKRQLSVRLDAQRRLLPAQRRQQALTPLLAGALRRLGASFDAVDFRTSARFVHVAKLHPRRGLGRGLSAKKR